MKRILAAILLIVLVALALTACGNEQIIDTTFHFDRAIISLPNGDIVARTVQGWRDYDDCDQIQIVINGKTYYVHHSNAVLIAD